MNRINFMVSPVERMFGSAIPSLASARLRQPLVALAASLLLVAVSWCVESVRLDVARRDGAAYARRLALAERDGARVRALERDVARLRGIAARIDRMRASGPEHASEIAALGNGLPTDAWLTSLRVDRAVVAVEGRSTRLGGVGTAMTSLAALRPFTGARLVAVHTDPVHAGVTYAIALERRP